MTWSIKLAACNLDVDILTVGNMDVGHFEGNLDVTKTWADDSILKHFFKIKLR
jgi:hypothetical protein